jgi:hypothetical protein
MMGYMEFVMDWYERFGPFFMQQVMDITICCHTPEKSRKKSEIIIQPVCYVNKHTAENKKQNSVQQFYFKLPRIDMMMLVDL